MADSVTGTTNDGQSVTGSIPVLVGGVDGTGVVRTLQVDGAGVVTSSIGTTVTAASSPQKFIIPDEGDGYGALQVLGAGTVLGYLSLGSVTGGEIGNVAAGDPDGGTAGVTISGGSGHVYVLGATLKLQTPQSGFDTGRSRLSGSFDNVQFVSGAAQQISTISGGLGLDHYLVVPVTFNPSGAAAATCLVEMSPDNITYSTLYTFTVPIGVTFDGTINTVALYVRAGHYVKLTTANATIGLGTFY